VLLASAPWQARAGGEAGPWRPVLEAPATGGTELDRYLAEDARWLAGQAVQEAVAPADTVAATGVDWSRLLPGVAVDSLPDGAGRAVRPLTSLLAERWQRRGHLACRVAVDTTAGARRLVVRPGPRYRIGLFTVGGDTFPGEHAVLARRLPRAGETFTAERLEEAVAGLLRAAGDAGYPFARWLVREVQVHRSPPRVDVTGELLLGRRAWLGPQGTSLRGERQRRFVARASGLRPGEPFRQRRLEEARRRLLRRDLYDRVEPPVVHTTTSPETVGVWWPIVPRRHANRLEVVLGLSRREGEPTRLSGQVRLLLPNLAGTGRRLDLGWSDDGRDRSRFGFLWREPLVGGSPLDLTIDVAHEVQRDVYTRFRTDLEASLPVAGGWDVALGVGWDRGTFPSGPWRSTGRLRTHAALVRRRIDRYRSGWSARLAVASARRSATARDSVADGAAPVDTVTAGIMAGQLRQTIVEADLAGEWFVGARTSLAGRASWRSLESDQPAAPLSEQFRLGGARSLRGYAEDRFHGERVGVAALELRLGTPGRSVLYTFYDVGYVRLHRPDGGDDTATPTGFGLGLETTTGNGEVSLAIGFPGSFRFDDAKLHVTLLQGF